MYIYFAHLATRKISANSSFCPGYFKLLTFDIWPWH